MIKIKAVDSLQEKEKVLSLMAEEPSDETSAEEMEPAKDKKNLVTRQRLSFENRKLEKESSDFAQRPLSTSISLKTATRSWSAYPGAKTRMRF